MTRATVLAWSRWLLLFALTTLLFRRYADLPELRISHGVLIYLLLVVGASREGRRWLSAVMVALSYLAVDWFFVPPRSQFGTPTEFDLIILIGFLVTSTVISQLVLRLKRAATLATARATEIERLGAERLLLEREASRAEALREAERLKNALIASLTHDLRSPITTLTMLSDPAGLLPMETALQRIAEETRRLDDFLRTLGRFTRSGGAGSLLTVEAHVAEDLIGTAIRSAESALQGRAVNAATMRDGELLLIRCDFTLSLQILGNLLVNAARYSPPTSPIEVSAHAETDHVRITVSDRGPGLAPDEIEQVFLPMQRGRMAAQLNAGTGMGLAIARTFAQAQHGDVKYAPRAGGGSHFHLLLPAAPPPAEPSMPT